MKDLNKIILIGRLGTDPIQRETKNGTPVTHFSLATARLTKQGMNKPEGEAGEPSSKSDEPGEETVWHDIVVWGRQAQSCAEYLSKGQTVYVEGSIRKRAYQNKKGENRISFEVHADSVGFLGGLRKYREKEKEISEVGTALSG